MYGDAVIVAKLREMVRAGKSDSWIGLQVRLLLEARAEELRELGVVELPDEGWTDTGTGPGYTGKTIPPIPGLHDSGDDSEADR